MEKGKHIAGHSAAKVDENTELLANYLESKCNNGNDCDYCNITVACMNLWDTLMSSIPTRKRKIWSPGIGGYLVKRTVWLIYFMQMITRLAPAKFKPTKFDKCKMQLAELLKRKVLSPTKNKVVYVWESSVPGKDKGRVIAKAA